MRRPYMPPLDMLFHPLMGGGWLEDGPWIEIGAEEAYRIQAWVLRYGFASDRNDKLAENWETITGRRHVGFAERVVGEFLQAKMLAKTKEVN